MEDDLDKVRNRYKKVMTWYRDGLENLSPEIERRELIKKVDASFSVFDHDHDVIRVMPAIHELQDFLEEEFSYLTKEDIDRVVPTIKKEGGYQFIRFRKLKGTSIYSNFHASRFHSAELWAAHTIVERIILLEEEIEEGQKVETAQLELGKQYPWAIYFQPHIQFQKDKTIIATSPLVSTYIRNEHLLYVYQFLKSNNYTSMSKNSFFALFRKINSSGQWENILPPKKKAIEPPGFNRIKQRLKQNLK